ncbi:cupin domain-containing protein [Herbaspirillum sp. alder98]|uniref:cupin domain-containing protein n=1 Tax=Herbaspirillum sp. alder98 TaxID=2913096 RepID=UPI001CD84132|nr:cupin [Herbaspirillum sp. alder98]MCA1326867.1 cupin [Herbaspirillum sp. alder98]
MAKCRVFAIDDNLKEIVADGLYGKHLFGASVSVAVVKFVAEKGSDLPAKSHSHGEEASLQLVGACSVFESADSQQSDYESIMASGDALIIPAGALHYGSNRFGPEGVSMRLNVVTPARKEYGPEDSTPYYPLKSRAD